MFYDIFTKLCESIGKSRSAVAEEIGLQRSVVSRWKMGSIPSGKSLEKLAIYFDVSKDYLLGKGDRFDVLSKKNRIFKVINDRRMSLDDLSKQSGYSKKEILSFAFLEQTTGMKECLEDVSKVLKVSEGYLIGMTHNPLDYEPYYLICQEVWELSDGDPYVAADLQQFKDNEEMYEHAQSAWVEPLEEIFSEYGIHLFVDPTQDIPDTEIKEIIDFICFIRSRSKK